MSLTFTVPGLPPTGNSYVRHAGGRHYKTQKALDYESLVSIYARGQHVTADKYAISIDVHLKDKRRRDLDNWAKCGIDSLVHCGVIVDDSRVHRLVMQKFHGDAESTVYTIEEMA